MKDNTPPFQIPMYEMPRAKAEEATKLKNGQRVMAKISEDSEWQSGVIQAQGHYQGRLLLGYQVKFDNGEVHTIEYHLAKLIGG